jgi:hypothetical protein
VRQASYHLSQPFLFSLFWNRVLLLAQAGLDCDSPIYASHCYWHAGMAGVHYDVQLSFIEMGYRKYFLLRLSLNHNPPVLGLPCIFHVFVKLILQCFFWGGVVNNIYIFKFKFWLLLTYRTTVDFCILVLYLTTLLCSFINISSFFEGPSDFLYKWLWHL